MHVEIEDRFFIKNPDVVEKNLYKFANFIDEKIQVDEYFVPKCKDFFLEKPTKEYFRIRHEDNKSIVGYYYCHFDEHGRLLKTDEYETNISNHIMMYQIFIKLGFKKKVTVKKLRKHFKYKCINIMLDYIHELGCFLEIEYNGNLKSIEKIRKYSLKLLDKYQAVWYESSNMGYSDMVLSIKDNIKNKTLS